MVTERKVKKNYASSKKRLTYQWLSLRILS